MIHYSEKKKWTIAMVNWKSEVFLKWQIKMLYDYHSPDQFRLVIVDHSDDIWRQPYVCNYSGLEIWKRDDFFGVHGCGLTRVLRNANSDYFLTQDPDFFWLRKGHLNWLEKLLKNNSSVGGRYPIPVSVNGSNPDLPACWGCAYHLKEIKKHDFKHYGSAHTDGKDTGWEVRVALQNKPFISFEIGEYKGPNFGQCNWKKESLPMVYYHENKPVAAHMFRGIYSHENNIKEFPHDTRNDYAKYFYESSV